MRKTKAQLNIPFRRLRRQAYNSFVLENVKPGKFKIVRWESDENNVPLVFGSEPVIHEYNFRGTVLKRKGIFKRKYQIDSLDKKREGSNFAFPRANCSTETSILEKILNFPLNLLFRFWPSDGPIGVSGYMDLVGIDYDFLRALHNSGKKTFEANYFYPPSCCGFL